MTEKNNEQQSTQYAGMIQEYSPVEAALAELREKYKDVVFPVETKEGMKDAKEVRQKLVKLRTGLESKRKEIKEPALRRTQAIDQEARIITAAIREIEDPIDQQIKAEEERVAAEKAAAEAAEKARKDDILSKITGIRNLPLELANASSEEILAEWNALASFEPDPDVFAEFMEDVQHAIEDTIAAMDALYNRVMAAETAQAALAAERKALEEERARMAAEREEMERMRAEMAAMKAMQLQAASGGATLVEGSIEGENDPHAPITEDDPGFYLPSDGAVIMPEDIGYDPEVDLPSGTPTLVEDVSEPVSFEVRQFALATAAQFDALADKCDACGAAAFATELRAVSYGLREGDHDRVIANADVQALKDADNRLIDATVNAIDAWGEIAQAAE